MKNFRLYLSLFILFTFSIYSCKHTFNDNSNLTDTQASKTNSNKSRGMDGDCLHCHKSGGEGGTFTLGGTVYKTSNFSSIQPNGFIKLYSGPNGSGTLLKTIQVDALGNFYSDANYNFGLPIYPAAVSTTGDVRYMSTSLTGGSCNSCHGISTDVINVN